MPADLRALTLWPEWAWAILHLGKRVENRDWPIPGGEWFALHAGKSIGGRPGWEAEEDGLSGVAAMAEIAGWPLVKIGEDPDDLTQKPGNYILVAADAPNRRVVVSPGPRYTPALPTWREGVDVTVAPIITSAIVGLFRVTAHHNPGTTGPWKAPGAIGNVFDFRPLRKPVPCKGAQGLWRVPADVAEKCRAVGTVGAR